LGTRPLNCFSYCVNCSEYPVKEPDSSLNPRLSLTSLAMYAIIIKVDNVIATTATDHLVIYDTHKYNQTDFVFKGTAAYTEYTCLSDLR